jgi:hypothetical protein
MESQPLTPSKRFHIFDVLALGTTACLVSLVVFLQVKVLPTYVDVMRAGGYQMPFAQRAATWVCNFTAHYVLAGLFFWALYALWRSRRTGHPVAFPRLRTLTLVNVVAVVLLMGQTSGFVGFAMHGFKATRNIITAQEQESAKRVRQPASLPQR